MIFDIGWEVTIPAIGLRPKGQGQNLARKRDISAAFQTEELRKRIRRPLGYKIGTVVDTNALKSKYGDKPSNALRVYSFTPDKKFLSFDEYTVTLTYKTSRVFSICASAPYSSAAFELAKSALERKFGRICVIHRCFL